MKNREYFIEEDGQRVGPLSYEQLKEKRPSQETLVWFKSLSDWTEIGEIPELNDVLKIKIEDSSSPPPLPNKASTTVQPSRHKMFESADSKIFFSIWTGVHLFALITSYSEIDAFNSGKPRTDKFWPLVEFFSEHTRQTNIGKGLPYEFETVSYFKGFFNEYDWSEFAVYVGGALLFYFVFKLIGDMDTQNPNQS